jgi:hypothetical protein
VEANNKPKLEAWKVQLGDKNSAQVGMANEKKSTSSSKPPRSRVAVAPEMGQRVLDFQDEAT